jgi:hypothetical protein
MVGIQTDPVSAMLSSWKSNHPPDSADEPGGWQEATVTEWFTIESTQERQQIRARFIIGVPMRNYRGPVSDEYATSSVSLAVGIAKQQIQTQFADGRLPFDAEVTERFRELLEKELRDVIPGAKVSRTGAL